MTRTLRCLGAITSLFATVLAAQTASAEDAPLRIGVITFLSGPAAGPFGVPAKNAADLLIDVLNKGGQIPGYEKKGFGGRAIEVVYVDEAGGPHQSGHRVPQSGGSPERRHGDRGHFQR